LEVFSAKGELQGASDSSSCLSLREPTSAKVFKAEFAAGAALYPQ